MAVRSRNPIPTPRDIAEEEAQLDTRRGRRHCPQHPSQQMIPIGVADVCPLDHSDAEPNPAA